MASIGRNMHSSVNLERIDALTADIKQRYWLPREADYRPGAWSELDARYREAHRAYHTWRHIAEVLARLEAFSSASTRRDIIVAAALWHDAVYDLRNDDGSPRADRDNVQASAALFRRYALHCETQAGAVEEMIMGTAAHLHAKPGGERYPGFCGDFDLFLDLDLGSLASPWDQFEANLDRIQFENPSASTADFYRSQIAMLTRFNQPTTSLFRRLETRREWSAAAAANLGRCIDELRERLQKIEDVAR